MTQRLDTYIDKHGTECCDECDETLGDCAGHVWDDTNDGRTRVIYVRDLPVEPLLIHADLTRDEIEHLLTKEPR